MLRGAALARPAVAMGARDPACFSRAACLPKINPPPARLEAAVAPAQARILAAAAVEGASRRPGPPSAGLAGPSRAWPRAMSGGAPFEVPSTQKAVCVDQGTSLGPESMALEDGQPVPSPAPGEVLIKVAYAGVNRPDVMQRKGLYPAPPGHSQTLGLEVSGTVVALGEGAGKRHSVGDKVCALLNGGGYAEFATAAEGSCMSIPKGLTLKEAASLPETYCTVWSNIFDGAGLKKGETILVHGGSSGIGTTCIQLSKAFGCTVFTTAGSDARRQACLDLGADMAINYREKDFAEEIRARLGKGKGVDVVLDMIGGEYVDKNLRILGKGGRHVSIAFMTGSKVKIDMMPVLVRGISITGSTLRPRSNEAKAAICRSLEKEVWPLFEKGMLKPVVAETLSLKESSVAHVLMEHGKIFGKVLLTVDDSM